MTTGRVTRPFGVKGWVKVEVLSTNPHRYRKGSTFLLEGREEDEMLLLEVVERSRGELRVKFKGFENRKQAERLRGKNLLVKAEAIGVPPEGSFWEHQVLGLEVRTVGGERLGEVIEIIETGANDVLTVRGEKDYMIPMIAEVVVDVDVDAGMMVVSPLPGLLEL